MKIAATVLLGPGSQETVGDAIRSVLNDVDGFVLIESGGGEDAVQAAMYAMIGSFLVSTSSFAWTGSYSDARNEALRRAREAGYDYAMTLDPDERVQLKEGWRNQLTADAACEAWICADKQQGYFKERVLKCSSGARWHGRVCESIEGLTVNKKPLPGVFWELPKDDGAERRRWERGVIECQRMIDDGDDCYRWRRHRGSCLMGLGRTDEAVAEYRTALSLTAIPEETAWIRYLLCEQQVIRADYDGAVANAGIALAEHAGFLPEFAWILAYSELRRGNEQNASRWAQIGANMPEDRTRIGFRGGNCRPGCRSILQALHASAAGAFQANDFERRKAFAPNYAQLAESAVLAMRPYSHLDLGAGNGLLVAAMKPRIPFSVGIELEESARAATREDIRDYITYGVGVDGWSSAKPAVLVSCLEVLEHVPAEQADAAVAAICGRATHWVLFSAAPPGQAGKGHINCQPKEYWREKFAANGFEFDGSMTSAVVDPIRDMRPCVWLPRNIMVFRRVSTSLD